MIVLEDIRSLSDFMRNAKTSLRRLQKTGRPEVLTVNGKAGVVVQDAAAYQKLLEELEDARTSEALRQAERGEGLPVDEAFALIRKRGRDRRKR